MELEKKRIYNAINKALALRAISPACNVVEATKNYEIVESIVKAYLEEDDNGKTN